MQLMQHGNKSWGWGAWAGTYCWAKAGNAGCAVGCCYVGWAGSTVDYMGVTWELQYFTELNTSEQLNYNGKQHK